MSDATKTSHNPSAEPSIGHKIARAMFVVVFFWVFWKFGGFLINLIIGRVYGEVAVAKDVYTFIYKIVIFAVIYPSLLKVTVPAFMPLFTERLERDEREAWNFANTVINLLLLFNVALLCVGVLFADKLVATLAPGFPPTTRAVAARLLRWMFPGIFTMNMCVMALAIQNAYKVFSYPAAGDATQKILWAIAILFGAKLLGATVDVIAYGFLLGCAAQLVVNLVGLRSKLHFYRLRMPLLSARRLVTEFCILAGFVGLWIVWESYGLKVCTPLLRRVNVDPQFVEFTSWLLLSGLYACALWWRARTKTSVVARFAALAAPLLLGILFARWRDLTTSFFQSFTKPGWFGDLELAKTIGNLPHIMFGQALAIAMLPYLCDLAAKKDWQRFGDVLTNTLRLLALIFVPLTVVLMALDSAIFQLIYDNGSWSEFDVALGGAGLSLFIWGLLFFAIENALMQSFFSVQRVWLPTLLGMAAAVFHTLFLVGLVRWLGFDYPYEIFIVAAVSLPASRAFKNIVLLAATRARVRILPLGPTLLFVAKLAVLTAGVWAAVHYPFRLVRKATPLDRFKHRRVLLDTFNLEPRGWFSRDADSLAIERTLEPGDELAVVAEIERTRSSRGELPAVAVRIEADGTANLPDALAPWKLEVEIEPWNARGRLMGELRAQIETLLRAAGQRPRQVRVHMTRYGRRDEALGAHFLACRYRLSARHSLFVLPPIRPSFERELNDFAAVGIARVTFDARLIARQDRAKFLVQLIDRRGRVAEARFELSAKDEWTNIDVIPRGGCDLGAPKKLRFVDITPVDNRTPVPRTLLLDNVRLVDGKGRRVNIDDFECGFAQWKGPGRIEPVPGEEPGERALRIAGLSSFDLTRTLRGYALNGVDTFGFKVRSDRAGALRISLTDVAGHRFELAPVSVPPSERRRRFNVSLRGLKSADGARLDPSQLVLVRLAGQADRPWNLWIDNVEFARAWTPRARLAFEILKAARVVLPATAGLVAFVVLVLVLRIEEGRTIFNWFREQAMAKLLRKARE